MKLKNRTPIAVVITVLAGMLYAIIAHAGTASATLTSFIQNGSITNTSGAGINIVEVLYSLGAPEDNLASWDSDTGGGTAEDLLSNPNFFQSVRWTGLSVAPGANFNFSGLDIDYLVTVNPLNVTGAIGDSTTLRNAFVEVYFSDGSSACARLVEQDWNMQQNLSLIEGASCGGVVGTAAPAEAKAVPTISAYGLALTILGMLIVGMRRLGVSGRRA